MNTATQRNTTHDLIVIDWRAALPRRPSQPTRELVTPASYYKPTPTWTQKKPVPTRTEKPQTSTGSGIITAAFVLVLGIPAMIVLALIAIHTMNAIMK